MEYRILKSDDSIAKKDRFDITGDPTQLITADKNENKVVTFVCENTGWRKIS